MNVNDVTLVIAIDTHHLSELKMTYPTWHRFKNDMLNVKRLVIYDKNDLKVDDFKFLINDKTECIPWSMDGVGQREEMLSSFIYCPARHVTTKWYLKLDVDTISTKYGPWINTEWMDDNVFTAQRWGYSKPANVFEILDDWGDTKDKLNVNPRLNIPYNHDWDTVASKRITSWYFLCNTEWTQFVESLCDRRLPFPSQDTLMYYVAKRANKNFRRVNVKTNGWQHFRIRNIKKTYDELNMDEYVRRCNLL
jgi:hypothetical protein